MCLIVWVVADIFTSRDGELWMRVSIFLFQWLTGHNEEISTRLDLSTSFHFARDDDSKYENETFGFEFACNRIRTRGRCRASRREDRGLL